MSVDISFAPDSPIKKIEQKLIADRRTFLPHQRVGVEFEEGG